MKITVDKKIFTEILAKIQGITGKRSGLAITENVLIQAEKGGITLMATDLETGFKGSYPADVEAPGALVVNSRKLFEIARDFPTEAITLHEVENKWIQIGNHKTLYKMVGMNSEEFPDIPVLEEVAFFNIDSQEFDRMIDQTVVISAPSDDKRAHINGVLFEKFSGKKLIFRMASTDGSRLSSTDYEMKEPFEFPKEASILVPKKGLGEVKKILGTPKDIQIGFMQNNFVFKNENETLLIRLLEGNFPKYQDILKKEGSKNILINRQLFSMMLKRMSILSSDTYKGVIFSFEDGRLTIVTTNPDIGESKEDMDISYKGPSIQAVFNPRFFIEILNVIEDEEVVLSIISEEKPCFIEGNKDKRFVSAIMPMRL